MTLPTKQKIQANNAKGNEITDKCANAFHWKVLNVPAQYLSQTVRSSSTSSSSSSYSSCCRNSGASSGANSSDTLGVADVLARWLFSYGCVARQKAFYQENRHTGGGVSNTQIVLSSPTFRYSSFCWLVFSAIVVVYKQGDTKIIYFTTEYSSSLSAFSLSSSRACSILGLLALNLGIPSSKALRGYYLCFS